MNLIKALNWRYAVRQFSSEKIEEKKVQELLTATRLSATSYGLQPYRLLLIKDKTVRQTLFDYSMGQNKVVDCSHLVVFAAQINIDDELIDRHIHTVAKAHNKSIQDYQGYSDHIKQVFAQKSALEKQVWAHQQCYIALGTLLTAAAVMKIDTCPMTGFEPEGFDRVLDLEKRGLESTVICALGKRHSEDVSARYPKVRYEHSEMVVTV